MSGRLSGEFHLTGAYERPVGFGAMTIDDGVAYGEPFQKATASLRFDGTGVRLDGLNLAKDDRHRSPAPPSSAGTRPIRSTPTAAAFRSSGCAFVTFPRAPLSGLAEFTATGSGTFDVAAQRLQVSASTICSSAKKASAWSTARWRCAAPS